MLLKRIVIVAAICFFLNGALARPSAAESWQQKVDPALLDLDETQLIPNGFLVILESQADVSGAADLATKEAKGQYVYGQLRAHATLEQAAIRTTLDFAGVSYRPYWIANMIWVYDVTPALVSVLGQRTDVKQIYTNPSFEADNPDPVATTTRLAPDAIEWNISQINAPAVWDLGYTGQGVVIGGQDTGYHWTHPALQNAYRGWDGTTADHNYNWHDAVHGEHWLGQPGNPCGFDAIEPCDDSTHGTHTMGTMVGSDLDVTNPTWPEGASNVVGVAPGAKWIGCRNMENSWGTPASYSECFEWFVAPTDLAGENADPTKAPHVINNSWSCPDSEGCTGYDIMQTVVDNVRAAGIVVVTAAGNSGPNCGTVNTPVAIYDSSFSVGATDQQDEIVSFSSRGSVTIDGSNRFKPDITAPGRSVRSTVPTGYGNSSGTSMAAPHVAGLVALLISVEPSLAGQVETIEQIIRETAVPIAADEACGGIPAGETPNAVYGAGRIDALAAVGYLRDNTAVQLTDHQTGNDGLSVILLPIMLLGVATLSYKTIVKK